MVISIPKFLQTYIADLEFVDDLVVLLEDLATLQEALEWVYEYTPEIGLEVDSNSPSTGSLSSLMY